MIRIRSRAWLAHRHRWITQHDQRGVLYRLLMLFSGFVAIITLHCLAMILFEGMTFGEALWFSIISVSTIGYGDYTATTVVGQWATALLICFFGIWLIAQLAGEWVDYRISRREAMHAGRWVWSHMREHLVLINVPDEGANDYLSRFIAQLRLTPDFAKLPVLLLTDRYPQGLPQIISDQGVVHSHVMVERANSLDDAQIGTAAFVVVLAKEADAPASDSLTLELLHRIQALRAPTTRVQPMVLVEAVQDENIGRFRALGAQAVMRPVRAYPELMVRAMVAPGSERLLENLFSHYGESARRYDITITGCLWRDIVSALMVKDIGLAMGYLDMQGRVITNPSGSDIVNLSAIYVLVHDSAVPPSALVLSTLSPVTAAGG